LADRWVDTPHVFPNCCHRCLKSSADDGPYWHEEWDYAKPDRWPGVTPESPRVARMFTCRRCYLHAAQTDGAPLADLSAKQLGELQERIADLETELSKATAPITMNVVAVEDLIKQAEVSPKPRKRAPAKKKVSSA